MGAHTLGRAHPEHSGYNGPWVADEDRLDNQYFRDLIIPWRQDPLSPQRPLDPNTCPNPTLRVSGNPLFQWIGPGGGTRIMLNTDMALAFDIENGDLNGFNARNGRSTCAVVRPAGGLPACPITRDESRIAVEEYAADNALWLRDFGAVYQKVIDH